MKKLLIILLMLCGVSHAQEIQQTHWCKTHDKFDESMRTNTSFAENIEMLDAMDNYVEARGIIIPVVVHILYSDSSEIISKEDIDAQIKGLNEDFSGDAWDVDKTPEDFKKIIGNLKMTFKLAKIDPVGVPTEGVTHTKTTMPFFSMGKENAKYNVLGGRNAWDTKRYLNIWVCNLESGLRGYAQFPGDLEITDGIVVSNKYFGVDDTLTVDGVERVRYHRVLTHEAGHWAGLYHIWGDTWCGDDRVKDTPTQRQPHWFCYDVIGEASCGSEDLPVNFMDYTEVDCMVMFTKGQKKRAMKAMKLFRSSIIRSGIYLTK